VVCVAEHCRAPGVPPGGVKSGRRYGVGQWVSYRCSEGLILIGSETRSCQKDGEWTGAEPHCQRESGGHSASPCRSVCVWVCGSPSVSVSLCLGVWLCVAPSVSGCVALCLDVWLCVAPSVSGSVALR
uniref:Sushi domain-containing protein n=1 Tax=Callorhinchus milii TaxID=7868 RepID=A0A4W3GZJ3_CALMI